MTRDEIAEEMSGALDDLLACCELNLDDMETETIEACEKASAMLNQWRCQP